MNHVLDQHIQAAPQLEGKVHLLKTLYQEKLYHQLSEELLNYIEEPALQQGDNLVRLYNGFVKEFESRIDPIKLIQIANAASDQFQTYEQKVTFISDIEKRLKDEQAKLLAQIKIGFHNLTAGKLEDTLQIIRDVNKKMERLNDLDPLVYSGFYLLSANYHAQKNNYEEFYKNGLQYLAYTPENKIKPEQKISISTEMALAVLVSKKIYNFSELLEQPVFKALEPTAHSWIYHLIKTFNTGDIKIYDEVMKKFQANINNTPTLKNNINTLQEKIRIMALLELIFSLPKNDRNVSFDSIAKVTGLNVNQVEPLIMRCMSLELIKGQIDEIDKVVRINWIVPRVLDLGRIEIMRNKIDQWNSSLGELIKSIEAQNALA